MSIESKPALRLALRVEGKWWNAYAAEPSTMDGAVLIGAIPIAIAQSSLEIKQDFIALMRKVVEASLGGMVTGWGGVEPAPESERSGHG